MTRHGTGPRQAASSLRELRSGYFERAGLPADGGYSLRWIRVAKRLPLYIMNTAPRRRAVPYHDLHHILTCYETSNAGEAEIGAWELAAGTRPHWMAAVLDLSAMALGLFVAPARTFRAFVRGRQSATLYAEPITDELLDAPADEVRARLGLAAEAAPGTPADALAFAATALLGVLTVVAFVVLAPLLLLVGPFLK